MMEDFLIGLLALVVGAIGAAVDYLGESFARDVTVGDLALFSFLLWWAVRAGTDKIMNRLWELERNVRERRYD